MTSKAGLAFGAAVVAAVALFVIAKPDTAPPPDAGIPASGQLPEGHPPLAGGAPGGAVAAAGGPFGTVLETLDGGGYTYARVDSDGEEIWVAGPMTALAEGDQISLAGAMGMQDFHASSLDRTFESILFLNQFVASMAIPEGNRGTVLEVAHAAGYTYLRLDRDGTEVWIAANQMEVEEGQSVSWAAGSPMQNFESPSLGRTFDEILFVDGLRIEG